MLAGRGFATAVCLIVIALTCVAFAKRVERERRLLRKLRERGALSFDDLSEDERDTVKTLRDAGVVLVDRNHGYLQPEALKVFRQKRVRLALSGALMALLLALVVALVLLR